MPFNISEYILWNRLFYWEKKLPVMQVHLHISWPGDLSVPADLLWAYCCWICKWSLPLLCILLVGRYMEFDVVSYTRLHCWICKWSLPLLCILADFGETYSDANFFIINSYSEDDVHNSIKYNVWASTPSGNKKLDAAYQEAKEKSSSCPVFLLFSVSLILILY